MWLAIVVASVGCYVVKLVGVSLPKSVVGNRRVKDILRELEIIPETVLVICGDDLVTADQVVREGDTIELRPVMSGGSAGSR